MNSHEKYQRSFGSLSTSQALRMEECTMDNRETGRGRSLRMSRRLLIACILIIGLLAMSTITYAATGRTITDHVKVFFSNGTVKDIEVVTTVDEEGNVTTDGNEVIDEEFPVDEDGVAWVRIEGETEDGEKWSIETGFNDLEEDESENDETEGGQE